jgi:hypothetical protein
MKVKDSIRIYLIISRKMFFILAFPPLSLTALKEYRPIVSPKPTSPQKPSSTINIQRRKPVRKAHFLWNQSIVSPTKYE